jgi:hypothetical protein
MKILIMMSIMFDQATIHTGKIQSAIVIVKFQYGVIYLSCPEDEYGLGKDHSLEGK